VRSTAGLALVLAACGSAAAPAPATVDRPPPVVAPAGGCASFERTEVGRITAPALDEISGAVASRAQRGVLWVHNDSGGGPRVYAIDPQGRLLATFRIEGAPAYDWEAIAIEELDGSPDRLWIGDVGDNGARDGSSAPRDGVPIVRIDEPQVAAGAGERAIDAFDTILLRYPDHAHDCEAIAIEPASRDLYVFAKEAGGPSEVFRARAPFEPGSERVLEQVATIDTGHMVTGADFSPDGRELLVRTYRAVHRWSREGGESWDAALARPTPMLVRPHEPQGESIAFAADGSGFYTITEGAEPPVLFFARRCAGPP
jgi:hypothetical protein